MTSEVTPRLIELTYEAALKSFWRKKALSLFLRTSSISQRYLATWEEDETKREFLDRLFQKLQVDNRGNHAISRMAKSLSEQNTFPDLRNWEDSEKKIAEAHRAVRELKAYLRAQNHIVSSDREREEAQRLAREQNDTVQRFIADREDLRDRLERLQSTVGTQEGGYAFQKWFYAFLDYCEITNKKPYRTGGREIDGSLTHDGTTYLIELKFTKSQVQPSDVDSLKSKVSDKADNTMGIFLSISGYSDVAIQSASGAGTTLLLLDHTHIYLALMGTLNFGEVVSRVRRHASQTGEAYLHTSGFGG